MTWTTEIPRVEGWYWCRMKKTGETGICFVDFNTQGDAIVQSFNQFEFTGERLLSLEFAGPLIPPT
jgi:hypothetical protein